MTTPRPGPVVDVPTDRRQGPVDQVIGPVATGLGDGVGWLAEHGVLFGVFLVLWIAFGAALVVSQGSVDQAWQAIRDLPLLIEIVVWVLFLPVVVGLWVWETSWPLILRLAVIIGIAGWNLLIFLPRALQAKP